MSKRLRLVVVGGVEKGKDFLLKENQTMTIGRNPQCHIFLADRRVSEFHGTLLYTNDAVVIEDRQSLNGIYHNGVKISKSVISVGDFLQIGINKFRLVADNESQEESDLENIEDSQSQTNYSSIIYRKETEDPTFVTELTESKQKELILLHEISKLLQKVNIDQDELLGKLLEIILNAFQVKRGYILCKENNDENQLMSIYRSRASNEAPFSDKKFQISRSVLSSAMRRTVGTVSANTLSDERFTISSSAIRLNIRSIVCVPLQEQSGSARGAIYLDSLGANKKFQQQDLDILTAIGRQVGLGMERMAVAQRSQQELVNRVKEHTAALTASERERRAADRALQQSEDKYRFIVENIPDIIWTADKDGNVRYITPNVEKILGYSPNDFVVGKGEFWFGIVHPSQVERVRIAYEELFTSSKKFDIEYRIRRHDGEWMWVHSRAMAVYREDEKMIADGLMSDITERKRYQDDLHRSKRQLEETLEQLRKTQDQIIQQERLHALGIMASGIAHDFNNALAPIAGFSELLLIQPKMLDNKEKVQNYLAMIHTASQDAAGVVRRLRDFYRPRESSEVFVSVDLNHMLQQAISLTQPKWRDQALAKGITVQMQTNFQDIPHITGNEAELREATTNIIFNAVDAMNESGSISIRTCKEDAYVVVEISDTGAGMSKEIRQKCLEPFFSTKGEKGTGLGLSMVFGTIKRHNGTVEINSKKGEGTTVIFRFPSEHQHATIEEEGKHAENVRKLNILFIDDEQMIRDFIFEYLTYDGHDVDMAKDGRDGLNKFNENKEKFDVVIVDMALPEISGDQLASSIKELCPLKPVILLTGFGDLMLAAREKPKGVDYILSKPVKIEALRKILAKATAPRTH